MAIWKMECGRDTAELLALYPGAGVCSCGMRINLCFPLYIQYLNLGCCSNQSDVVKGTHLPILVITVFAMF